MKGQLVRDREWLPRDLSGQRLACSAPCMHGPYARRAPPSLAALPVTAPPAALPPLPPQWR